LIEKNVRLKWSIVASDPWEQNERRLLNFGHTIGHAIEYTYHLSHGEAIAIGMMYAAKLSAAMNGLKERSIQMLQKALDQYQLPTQATIDWKKIAPLIQLDKKRKGETIRFIVLTELGKGTVQEISLETLQTILF
jgi:3-dehydroquinate synthase